MNLRRNVLKMISCAAAIAVLTSSGLPASASSSSSSAVDNGTGQVTGSVGINGTIMPLTITVSHQLTLDYTIDPNTGTITADPITVTNGSRVPVNVSVQSISSVSGGDITFTDVGPNDKDWANLSTADSIKYIALGVKIGDSSGWSSGYNADTDWAASGKAVWFGKLPVGATGNLALTAKTGLAFTSTYTSKASIILVVSLV
jgi:hypothetical protein